MWRISGETRSLPGHWMNGLKNGKVRRPPTTWLANKTPALNMPWPLSDPTTRPLTTRQIKTNEPSIEFQHNCSHSSCWLCVCLSVCCDLKFPSFLPPWLRANFPVVVVAVILWMPILQLQLIVVVRVFFLARSGYFVCPSLLEAKRLLTSKWVV